MSAKSSIIFIITSATFYIFQVPVIPMIFVLNLIIILLADALRQAGSSMVSPKTLKQFFNDNLSSNYSVFIYSNTFTENICCGCFFTQLFKAPYWDKNEYKYYIGFKWIHFYIEIIIVQALEALNHLSNGISTRSSVNQSMKCVVGINMHNLK